jgi:hypothetical protein
MIRGEAGENKAANIHERRNLSGIPLCVLTAYSPPLDRTFARTMRARTSMNPNAACMIAADSSTILPKPALACAQIKRAVATRL